MSYLMNQIQNLIQISKQQESLEPYYEVLEYVYTTSSQCWDTGVVPASDLKVDITYQSSTVTSNGCCFGARNSSSGTDRHMFAFWQTANGYMRFDFNDNVGSSTLSSSNAWQNVVKDGRYNYVNGTAVASNTETTFDEYENTATITLGCIQQGSGTSITRANGIDMKLQQCKMWKTGVLIRDYVPSLDSQLRPCLYDKVSKTFLYASTLSSKETTYDLEFKRWKMYEVDYIENTGTSYIPFTDITPSTTMGMNIEYAYTVLSSSEPAGVIGTYNGDTQRKDTFFVSTSSGYTQKASSPSSASCGVMVFHRGGNVGTSSSTSASYIEPEKDVWYKATVNWLGDGEITWTDGTNELSASVGANAVVTNQLRLFSRCNSSNNTYNNCKSRTRKLQFSDGSNIIRSYKPVVWHNSDTTAIATLYDEIYNKMATPVGSLKAYITTSTTAYTLNDGVQNDDYYLAENGTKTVSSDHTSCYTNAIPVKQGDIVEWTVTAEQVSANKRIHGYTTNADIEVGTTGSWVEMLAKIVFSTTSDTTQTVRFVIPSGINYIRLSHANVRESACNITITTPYEVGKSASGTPSGSVSGVSNCFDTGLYGTQDTIVKYIAVAYDNESTSGQLFGSYDGTQTTSQNLTINSTGSSGNTAPIRFDGKVITTPIRIALNKTVSIVNSKYGLWVNDTLHGSWGSVNDFTTLTTLLILKCNNSTNVRNNGCGYCLILDKDVPVAEYIPVKNGSTIGLYDRVSKELNTGVGTINFNSLD